MNLEIGKTMTSSQLQECEHISTYGVYDIYFLSEDISFLFAIDSANLICSCFEFHDREDGMQLAHMHTMAHLKRQGIGKAIMKEAVDIWTTFELPSTDNNHTYYYIENGLSFIQSCFEDGILTDPPFEEPYT
ncbi:MAG: hypothetical protein JW729_01960 [Bacteroidales bacterium]|nr:hypothetical protein [Bacteroidales bacterium]